MKINAKAGKQVLEVIIERQNGCYVIDVDGNKSRVDAHKLEGDFYSIVVDGRSYEVSVQPKGDGYHVRHGAAEQLVTFSDPSRSAREAMAAEDGPAKVITVMPGKVVRVLVNEGDTVEAGQGIAVVEAMKMENEITAPRDGTIKSLEVQPSQTVEGGATLAIID